MAVILTLKGERKSYRNQKRKNIQLTIKMERRLKRAQRRTTSSEYFRQLWEVAAQGSKALALVDNNSSSRGVSWRQFAEKLGIVSASGKRGVYNLMEIIGA